jgi:hypothetical protein
MTGTPIDRRDYRPRTADELMSEFPDFAVVHGTRCWFARNRDAPLMKAPNLIELRDQIVDWVEKRDRRHQP